MAWYENLFEAWYDYYKSFTYAFRDDPIAQRRGEKDFPGVGVSQPDAVPDIRGDGSFWGGGRGMIRLRDSNDFIDLSSVTNRQSRYKEYERLRNVAEIETALNIFADESCVGGDTKVATPFGFFTIKELAEQKKPEERFLVYCYDHKKQDYTLGWAFHPRKVKTAPTVRLCFDDGSSIILTSDHKVLLRSGEWTEAGNIKFGDKLMPFYRIPANQLKTQLKHNQFPRIFTFKEGWMHERQFVDVWKLGGKPCKKYAPNLNKVIRHITAGLTSQQMFKTGFAYMTTLKKQLAREGFSVEELRYLGKRYEDHRLVVGTFEYLPIDVYDLSVEEHRNFATDSIIVHNCQKGDNNHVFEIITKNKEVKKELEFLFHRILKIDKKIWNYARNLFLAGDLFLEICIDEEKPSDGILRLKLLPPDSVYRIETTKGKLIEFQQSKEGPDYQSLARVEVTKATDAELSQATALRFASEQISHWRIGDDRRTFYPYGVSLVEAARGPAHQLRLLEDAMLVYRLARAPERRVFYIDVQGMTPAKAEAFVEQMKNSLRKKKLYSNKSVIPTGASAVEERWHAPAQDEDFWIPIRPNVNTRVETLPGASNLGEVDDAVYFRNKLMIALGIPRNYLNQEDPQITKISLSNQDVRFSRFIERLQLSISDGLLEIAERHLRLRGYPEDWWDDLDIAMTPPSEHREISRQEVLQLRFNNASSMKSAQLMADYDIFIDILKIQPDKARELVERNKMQKLEDMKITLMGQNPELVGIGQPGQEDLELGGQAGGPTPMLGGETTQQAAQQIGGPEAEQPGGPETTAPPTETQPLAEPKEEEIRKYDLEIKDYSKEKDEEEVDASEVEGELD
jgi:hypothetical protein